VAITNELFIADHKPNDRFRIKYLHMLKITKMASIIKFEVIPDKFNVIRAVFFFHGVGLTSPGTAATSGLLYSPR
jgi:hypothetical protein